MGDYDRDRDPIRDTDREGIHGDRDRGDRDRVRETDRTTIVHTDGGRRSGGGVLVAVLLLIAVLVLLFFLFGGGFSGGGDNVGVDIDVETPELSVPEVSDVDLPDVNINVPDEINIDTDAGTAEAEPKGAE